MLAQTYDPTTVEQNIDVLKNIEASGDSYTVLMPPPNVTGRLHVGHALNHTLQDILCRYQRQQGRDVLWQPGTDHAGIATQMVVERQLDAEGLNRKELGRETFLKRVWQWKEESGGAIVEQLKRLGASANWDRQRFTMDDGCSAAVRKTFVDMYNDGLIKPGVRLVNWDCSLQTAISDLEVEQREIDGAYYHINYELEAGGTIEIATTRPETLLGDTAIAVNPEDERYKKLVGTQAIVPIVNRSIPIVADDYSDMEKGTGAVKITPAHDFNDFEVGQRHDLEQINILNKDGTLNDVAPQQLQGLDRLEARKKIVEMLGDALVDVKKVKHTVPFGDRSGTVIEPYLTKQWFADVEPLAKAGLEVVKAGYIKFIPDNWTKTYDQWLENIQPWCISRQLWWGHRIPAWYDDEGNVYVAETEEEAIQHSGGKALRQDNDVLDTWFSSGLWPLSTLNWPQSFEASRYPTQALVTGFDIIFFWVARMIMMCLYVRAKEEGIVLTNTKALEDLVPFRDVYVHALVRDKDGQKMSKSKGNVIDPIKMANEFGADALRMALASQAGHGRDVRLSEDTVKGYRNFCNKLWNAARFGEMNGCFEVDSANQLTEVSQDINCWIINELQSSQNVINAAMADYQFNLAVQEAYQFTWNTFCDWYLERAKPLLNKGDIEAKVTFQAVYYNILKMLHPVMPYVTATLIKELYNTSVALLNTTGDGKNAEVANKLITAIRSTRAAVNVRAGAKLKAYVVSPDQTFQTILDNQFEALSRMARLETIETATEKPANRCLQVVIPEGTLFLDVEGIVDMDAEISRLQKNIDKLLSEKTGIEKRLSNDNFVSRAPASVVEENKQRVLELSGIIEKQEAFLKTL